MAYVKSLSPVPPQKQGNSYFIDVFKTRLVGRPDSPHIIGTISRRDGRRLVQVRKFQAGEATKQGFSTSLQLFKQLPFGVKPPPTYQNIEEQLLFLAVDCGIIIASIGREQNRAVTGLWLTRKEWCRMENFVNPLYQAFKNSGMEEEERFEELSAEEDECDEEIVKVPVAALFRQPAKRKTPSAQVKPRGKKLKPITEEPLDDNDSYPSGSQQLPLFLD